MVYRNDKKTIGSILEMTFSEEARKKYEGSPFRRIRMNTVDFSKARENASEIGPEAVIVLTSHRNAGLIEVYEDEEAELTAYLSAALDNESAPEFVDLAENDDPEEAELSAWLSERL